MTNHDRYERCRAAIHCRPDQMRARVLSVLFEHFDQEVAAQDVVAAIGTTPMHGARGGEPCEVRHVMAKMTLGYLQYRLYQMTDYRIVVDIKRSAILVTTKEKAAGVKTHVFPFANFTGHDPRKDIRVDEQSRYLDEALLSDRATSEEDPSDRFMWKEGDLFFSKKGKRMNLPSLMIRQKMTMSQRNDVLTIAPNSALPGLSAFSR
jgi:hypothetical protein